MSVKGYYENDYDEDSRLAESSLEWLRTRELIGRVLPQEPSRVADVAGGTGLYSLWLASLGHRVSLLDLTPSHVEQARTKAAAVGADVDCVEGDARSLPWPDASFDVVLVMGALYHLQDPRDRLACLREAHRVLKPGGILAAAYICRWAPLFDGYRSGFVTDPRFRAILEEDLATGRHENPDSDPHWFTTAYFHTPAEIRDELDAAGFAETRVLPVEGFASATSIPAGLLTGDALETALEHLRATEDEPALLGVSSHLMSFSRRP